MKPSCLLLLSMLLWFCSCLKKYDCEKRIISEVNLNNRPKTDSVARVIRCEKGSNFTKRIDSVDKAIGDKISGSTYFESSFGYKFSDVSCDYMIVLLPTGKTYKVTDIRYGNESVAYGGTSGGEDRSVKCSYGYTLDGKVITHEAETYGRGSNFGRMDL